MPLRLPTSSILLSLPSRCLQPRHTHLPAIRTISRLTTTSQSSSSKLIPLLSQKQPQTQWSRLNSSSSTTSPTATVTATASSSSSTALQPPVSILDSLPGWAKKSKPYLELMRLDKPIGTALLYWPCAWSITLASTHLSLPLLTQGYYLALFGIGAIIMRGAGCTINDLWDRKIDEAVERTKTRPLARGAVTNSQAIGFLGLQLTAGLGVLTQLNMYSIGLGACSLALVGIYPLMKRITYFPQVVLGLAFNWGALLGYSALAGTVDWQVCLPLYAAGVCWTLVYDTIYAHQDKVDDVLVGVKSTALYFSEATRPILAGLSVATISLLTLTGYTAGASLPFYLLSVGGGSLHLLWQLLKVDFDKRSSCWRFFVSNGWLGGLIWLGFFGDYLMTVGLGV